MQDHDKLWIVLPTEIWCKLFSLAIRASTSVNEYLQILIEQEAQNLKETENPVDSPQTRHL